MRQYIRSIVPGGTYFFTLTLERRRGNRLLVEHADLLRRAFRKVRHDWPFDLDAIVVLPEHLHCLWTLPLEDGDYSTRWRLIKSFFVRGLEQGEAVSASRSGKGERGIWQRRFWEHTIRDEEDYRRHVEYIHFNPVKHGLVDHPAKWPWSSFHSFARRGLYPPDWTVPQEIQELELE